MDSYPKFILVAATSLLIGIPLWLAVFSPVEMDSYPKFILVAATSLLIGIPLWLAVFSPELLSVELFTSVGFWIPIVILLLVMLFGFWIGQQSKFT
ncbi:hypothetical protein C492_11555 [Natronococcus jeotgali DSM 18795]|uniref:Uncharacterized protein n=1 Tax=Natronococcus jeotgali DSM 18795 TaxID=1227498 RepID=L9XAQ7_9EURY|nr:hypothetical protein C492_11555 [Natronococcus jeotgali DSM 18795]